jgi:hypothetical protein
MRFRQSALAMAAASLLLLPAQSAAAVGDECTQCDKRLELTDAQMQCLRKQLPTLAARKTKFVFFSLDGPQCAASASERVRSSDTRMPPSKANAPRIFRLTNEQLSCLNGKINRITPRNSRYVIDVAALRSAAVR